MKETGGCQIIDGAIVCVKSGERLTDQDVEALRGYIKFCRARTAKKSANRNSSPSTVEGNGNGDSE